jgi:hypothetical protein
MVAPSHLRIRAGEHSVIAPCIHIYADRAANDALEQKDFRKEPFSPIERRPNTAFRIQD